MKESESTEPKARVAAPKKGSEPRFRPFMGPQGLQAKWRALLFVVGMVLSLSVTLLPVNWLASRGVLEARAAWTAGVQWAAFLAALLPTLVASRIERRPVGSYGLP